MDAVSMYTNIDTALESISGYLARQPDWHNHHTTILRALEIVMRYCYFSFGDTAWHQIQGTAMSALSVPAYATIYYGIHEVDTLLPATFRNQLVFYYQYIDDDIGAWTPHTDPQTDEALWTAFQEATPFGRLTWEFSPRQSTVNFLDLCIRIHPDGGSLRARLYEKALNLYLYLPPHSAHPPGILRGFVIGMLYRIYTLTTDPSNRRNDIRNLYLWLRNRGYRHLKLLSPM
jgi:hypothetical protein